MSEPSTDATPAEPADSVLFIGQRWRDDPARWAQFLDAYDRYCAAHPDDPIYENSVVTLSDRTRFPLGAAVRTVLRAEARNELTDDQLADLDDESRQFEWEPPQRAPQVRTFDQLIRNGDATLAVLVTKLRERPAKLDEWIERGAAILARNQGHPIPRGRNVIIANDEPFALGNWLHEVTHGIISGELEPHQIPEPARAKVFDPRVNLALTVQAFDQYHRQSGLLLPAIDHVEILPREITIELGTLVDELIEKPKLRPDVRRELRRHRVPHTEHHREFAVGYAWLARFRKKHGHACVPTFHVEYDESGNRFPLGGFIAGRRKANSGGWIESWQRDALDELGMVWNYYEYHWQHGLKALGKFYEEEKTFKVPRNHKVRLPGYPELDLSEWIHTLRDQARKQDPGLTEAQWADLAPFIALGFDVMPNQAAFLRNFAALQAFFDEHGHTRVTASHDKKLFGWVSRLRSDRRALRDEGTDLHPQLAVAFADLEFEWEPFDADFDRGVAAFERFVRDERHRLVPREHQEPMPDGSFHPLGRWSRVQRTNWNSLAPHRRERLIAVGFPPYGYDRRTTVGIEALEQYLANGGTVPPPMDHVETLPSGKTVALWSSLESRRVDTMRGVIAPAIAARINELGIDLNVLAPTARHELSREG